MRASSRRTDSPRRGSTGNSRVRRSRRKSTNKSAPSLNSDRPDESRRCASRFRDLLTHESFLRRGRGKGRRKGGRRGRRQREVKCWAIGGRGWGLEMRSLVNEERRLSRFLVSAAVPRPPSPSVFDQSLIPGSRVAHDLATNFREKYVSRLAGDRTVLRSLESRECARGTITFDEGTNRSNRFFSLTSDRLDVPVRRTVPRHERTRKRTDEFPSTDINCAIGEPSRLAENCARLSGSIFFAANFSRARARFSLVNIWFHFISLCYVWMEISARRCIQVDRWQVHVGRTLEGIILINRFSVC